MSDDEASTTTIGWIGTGRMGSAMVSRLLANGVPVTAWNRTRAKAQALAAGGVTVAESLDEVAGHGIVFTSLADDGSLLDVTTGEDGLFSGTKPAPTVLVDTSTVSVSTSEQVREAAERRGCALLAAPISGNPGAVTGGSASFCVSGPEQAHLRVRPYLEAIASATYVGEGERSRYVKICHNLLLAALTQSLAEITVLAERCGVSRGAVLEFINGSVLGSPFTRYKSAAFTDLDFTPTFTTTLLRKDMRLGLEQARERDVTLPVMALVNERLQAAIGHGGGDSDFAVLLELLAGDCGLELRPEEHREG